VTSAPSEARKRGSGGGSPRKHDDLLTCPSDLLYEGDGDTCDQFSVFGTYRPVDQFLNIKGDDSMGNEFLTAHPPSAWSLRIFLILLLFMPTIS
jgi:hypothetical protein